MASNRANIDALTGLRGLAAWWVVVYHFREALALPEGLRKIADAGYLAVDIFFVLSGFVLIVSYGGVFAKNVGRVEYFAFFLRRFARIYPLHLFVMLLFLLNPLAIHLFSSQSDFGGRYDASYFFYSIALVQNWGLTSDLQWNIPAWSISVEWFASLIFPFLVWGLLRIRVERWVVALLVVMVICAALALIFSFGGYRSIGDGIPSLGLYRCILEFSLGVVAGILYKNRHEVFDRLSKCMVWMALIAVLVGIYMGWSDYYFVPAVSFVFILGISYPRTIISGLLGKRILVFLGEISYSTYIIHFFCKDWVKFFSDGSGVGAFGSYLLLVFVSSIALYRFVEIPCKSRLYQSFSRGRTTHA